MADVVTKCISANDVDNGVVTIRTSKLAHQTNVARETTEPNITYLETVLTGRFDDRDYYTN